MEGKSLPDETEAGRVDSVLELSLVIPLYNEVDSLPHLIDAIDSTLLKHKIVAEILFINDGSTDGSDQVLSDLEQKDNRIRIFSFRRNRGKSAALDVGFRHAKGKYVITMDADLQDDPEEIPKLITKIEEGFDVVSGWKKKRYDPISKTIPSKVFNWAARTVSGIKLHDFNCGLKIYRREVLDTIRVYGELHRFIPILAAAQGWRIGELVVQHHPRKWGKTKFGFTRFFSGLLDLISIVFITRFTSSPMHLFGSFGFISLIFGFFILAYLSIGWFIGDPIGQRPLFFLGILLVIVGIQFFSMGWIGEMISHMFAMAKNPKQTMDD
ncbi:glycosyltransferase [bacterium]|nr:glycosyltransferase [bacterium]